MRFPATVTLVALGAGMPALLESETKHMAGQKQPQGMLWLDPRCSVLPTNKRGPFIKLNDGSLMIVEESATRISRDEGRTWSEPRPICEGVTSGVPSSSRALLKTLNGVIILVYMDMATYKWNWEEDKGHASADTRLDVWSIRSLDEGKTWVDRHRILDGYCGALIDMIQLRSGEIVVPVQDLTSDRKRHGQYAYVSADEGKTWIRSNLIDLGGHGHHDGAFESTLAELNDGRLLMLIRTSLDRFWEAISTDKGRSWRILRPSTIDASNSPGYLTRVSSGRLMLVWNRLYLKGKNTTRRTTYWRWLSERPCSLERSELSIAFSEDDGKTWTDPAVFLRYETQASYPHIYEHKPGELWMTTMFGQAYVKLKESDFIGGEAKRP
jgi:hypothetical protein